MVRLTVTIGLAILSATIFCQAVQGQGVVLYGQPYYQPILPQPIVVQRPLIPPLPVPYVAPVVPYVAQAPIITYRPIVGYPSYVPNVVRIAPPVVVRSRYYVPGQPVRNLLKVVAP